MVRAAVRRVSVPGLIAVLIVAAVFYTFKVSERLDDFDVYVRAASRAWSGESLYRAEDGHWLFKYLPGFAVLAVPIALVPLPVAKLLWFLASVVGLILLLTTTVDVLPVHLRRVWVLVTATVGVLANFYAHELNLGQTNLFLTLAVVGAVLAMKHQRETLAGGLVAVAIVFKPYAVLLLPWLAIRRGRRSMVAATVGTLLILLLPVMRYGFEGAVQLHVDWWHTVTTSTEGNLGNIDNVSWLAMYSRWLAPGRLAQALTMITVLAALWLVADVIRRRNLIPFPELLEVSLLLTLMPLLSPQGWAYTLLTATPAVMCLVNYSGQLPAVWRNLTFGALAVVGLSIYDVMGRTLYTAFMRASGLTVAFFAIILSLAMLRWKRIA